MTHDITPATQRLLGRTLWTLTIVYWLILFGLTHIPAGHVPPMPLNDKTEHLLSYGGLGGLLMLLAWARRPRVAPGAAAIVVLAIGMCYGAIDEWTQALPFIRRDCSILDWHADCAGLAIAVVAMTAVRTVLARRDARPPARYDPRA